MSRHPDIDWKVQSFGVANTSLGRGRGGLRKNAASVQEQEERMGNAQGWKHNGSSFHPVRAAIEGARAFANEKGLRDPHEHDFARVMQTADRVRAIGRHYDAMPEHDSGALTHFHAMRDEMKQQHDFATKKMGIHFQTVDHDPYSDVHEMVHDVATNKRLKVLGTHVTGKHPVFSDEENDQFRGVHDLFGHAATGRDFSRHGEEAAFQAHSRMFSQHARPAMAAETRGQNSSLILNGHFGPQKVGILPPHMHDDASMDLGPKRQAVRQNGLTPPDVTKMGARQQLVVALAWRKPGIVMVAHDSGDGETIFHCSFCGSGQVIARSDGTVDCDFCHTAFTVQVQPEMPAFPQTVNGQPIDVPGMPAGGANANVPPGAAPGADPMADPDAVDPASGEGQGPEEGDPTEDDTAEGGPPDFLKNSYRTHFGDEMSRDSYMRHLAIIHAEDQDAMMRQVKESR